MKKAYMAKFWRRKDSGQVLIVAALSVALIIISTVAYVYELNGGSKANNSTSLNDYVLMIQSGTRHVLLGSLANITHGDASNVLWSNLQRWSMLVSKQYTLGKCLLDYMLVEASPYSSGVWISWASNGVGISSACANFGLEISDRDVDVQKNYFLNVSTVLQVQGGYMRLSGGDKNVTLLINLLNEDEPALARTILVYYRNLDEWFETDYVLTDYGNGTCHVSFATPVSSDTVEVSVRIADQRDIIVMANATCAEA